MIATFGQLVLVPVLPIPVLAAMAVLGAIPLALAVRRRAPGTVWRGAAWALPLLVLLGPSRELRTGTKLPDIALLVVDHSASMQVGTRAPLAEQAARRLAVEAAARPDLVLRRVDVPAGGDASTGGTRLFAAIDAALADVPPDQRAGVIALTDGMVSDAPRRFALPLDVLIPAAGEQTDRRLRITLAPGYGIVGGSVRIGLTVDDRGTAAGAGPGAVTHLRWSQDGTAMGTRDVAIGTAASLTVPISRPGPTTIAIAVDPLPGEASLLNNRAALTVNGVRDRLRVLLISGEPNAGERSWRGLLKADPAVDLVHFTILRPPGMDDLTPASQLALIAFPEHELFVDRLRQFDLVILDRFANAGLLPDAYLGNIADYVRGGGALLVSAGPEFAGPGSIARGPLGDILPAQPPDDPDGVVTGAFRPMVTALGERHPVTAALPGDVAGGIPRWGHWYRRIDVAPLPPGSHAQAVLAAAAGPAAAPLLLLDHVGEGRVALLLSDQMWLWARGHEGGGPDAELLRRVAHWLMREPQLDETALTASIAQGVLHVRRRSLAPADPATPFVVTDPDGTRIRQPAPDGAADLPATLPGLWRVQFGTQLAWAAAAPADPTEFDDLRATATVLRPIARTTGWLLPDGAPSLADLPLVHNRARRLTSVTLRRLLPSSLAMPLMLLFLIGGWWRESHMSGT